MTTKKIAFAIGLAGVAFTIPAYPQATSQPPTTQPQPPAPQQFESLDDYFAKACKESEINSDPKKADVFAQCIRAQYALVDLHMQIQIEISGLTSQDATKVQKDCAVEDAGSDLSRLRKAAACIQLKSAILQRAKAGQSSSQAMNTTSQPLIKLDQMAAKTETVLGLDFSEGAEKTSPGSAPPVQQPGTPKSGGSSKSKTFESGQHVGSSAYRTHSTCQASKASPEDNALVTSNPDVIGVRREIIAPKEASDIYGHRLGKRYVIYQVRVSNFSKDYQYVVHDISLNLQGILPTTLARFDTNGNPLPLEAFQASSRELSLLRGVAEKGQDLDPRNLTLHMLQGIGSVAGGVSGLTPFTGVMGSAVGVFNGAFMQAFIGVLPDHTSTQLNRLSDEAFAANTLIDKLHTKVFAVFLPESVLLNDGDQKLYWNHPEMLLTKTNLDEVDVCVDGSLVTEATVTPDPSFSLDAGNVASGAALTLSDTTSSATIYYTTDGSTPTTNSTKYTAPIVLSIQVGNTETVQAMAVAPNQSASAVTSKMYKIADKAPTPAVDVSKAPAGQSSFDVNLSFGATQSIGTIYYTTDGSTPTTSSSSTSASIKLTLTPGTKLKAIATGSDYAESDVMEADY